MTNFEKVEEHNLGFFMEYYAKFENYAEDKKKLKSPHQCATNLESNIDPVARFRWEVDHPQNPAPQDFENFAKIMDSWAVSQKLCALTIAEMLGIGLGL